MNVSQNEWAEMRDMMARALDKMGAEPAADPEPLDSTKICDGLDLLAEARAMADLIMMTCRHEPDDDQKALAAGCDALILKLDQCRGVMRGLLGREDIE